MDRNYVIITFILRKPRVDNFPDIMKTAIMFIKKPLQIQKKLKELEVMY